MKPGELFDLVRRTTHRGVTGAYHHYFSALKILRWRFPYWALDVHPVPVHVVAGKEDWLVTAWMLVSFFLCTKHNWNIHIHDDGTLPAEAEQAFKTMFPTVRVIWRPEADDEMDTRLASLPACRKHRQRNRDAMRIFDVSSLTPGERFILLDSHLVFFKKPDRLLEWADSDARECLFARDCKDHLIIRPEDAKANFGSEPWEFVHQGIGLLVREAVNLLLCESVLQSLQVAPRKSQFAGQTLYALCASQYGAGGLLPRTYEVSYARTSLPASVARVYPGYACDRFYAEAVPRLMNRMNLEDGVG